IGWGGRSAAPATEWRSFTATGACRSGERPEGFRRGTFRVLVATDIAARGIDVANIGHVVNYDLPNTPEDYIHRIGRTARVKASGRATSFVTADDHVQLRAIEKLLGRPVPLAPGSAPAAHPAHSPRHNGQRDARPGRPSGFRPGRPVHAKSSHRA